MKYFLAGTFDQLHVGHQHFLWTAVSQATDLHIIVARDKTVEQIKKHAPQNNENQRLQRIREEKLPHTEVSLGREDFDIFKTLSDASPDVLFLGYDQRVDTQKIQETFPDLKILRAKAYAPQFFKSSLFPS